MRTLEQLAQFAPGPDGWALAAMVWSALVVFAHVGFAAAVAAHGRGRAIVFAPTWLWVLGTLACGPLVGVGYWFLHASKPATLGQGVRGASSAQRPVGAGSGVRG